MKKKILPATLIVVLIALLSYNSNVKSQAVACEKFNLPKETFTNAQISFKPATSINLSKYDIRPGNGKISISNNTITYEPLKNFYGVDSIQVIQKSNNAVICKNTITIKQRCKIGDKVLFRQVDRNKIRIDCDAFICIHKGNNTTLPDPLGDKQIKIVDQDGLNRNQHRTEVTYNSLKTWKIRGPVDLMVGSLTGSGSWDDTADGPNANGRIKERGVWNVFGNGVEIFGYIVDGTDPCK